MLAWLSVLALLAAAEPATDRWEVAIAAFEAKDKESPPPREGIVFVGASSIRLWDVHKAFPDLPVINRGFGGSQMGDSLRYADRIVLPYAPRIVVVNAGGNDLAAGKTPDEVCENFKALVAKIHAQLPATHVYYVSLYPSPKRWKFDDKMRDVSRLIETFAKTDERLHFIDTRAKLSAPDGGPRPELLRADELHLNDKGYQIWNEIVGPILRADFKKLAPNPPKTSRARTLRRLPAPTSRQRIGLSLGNL